MFKGQRVTRASHASNTAPMVGLAVDILEDLSTFMRRLDNLRRLG